MRNFLHDYLEADVVFDPDAVGILIAAFDGALQSIKARLSDKQIELVRATLAKYIIEQARRGELDECRLRDGALLHLAQSNLRREPPQGHDKRSGHESATVAQSRPRHRSDRTALGDTA